MSKVLVLLAEGFEDIEAIATIDLLRRGNVVVDLATIGKMIVKSGRGINIECDLHLKNATIDEYDLLFLPGGAGVKILDSSIEVRKTISEFIRKDKFVAAICAAPLILGKMEILNNRVFTCYPSFEQYAPEGIYQITPVIQDGKIITGRGVAYVNEFALHVLEVLEGKETRHKVEESTLILEQKKGLLL
jgi:4-methyl-5(b-hydroxyethyl)-thiazole monophosphate biosynthesis